MHNFRDKTGNDWSIELTAGSIVRIRAESDGRFDLFKPAENDLATRLADDLCLCWELLWFVCSPQARERKLTADTFGVALADDLLLDAQGKLFEEWREFFRRCQRPELALVVEKVARYQAKKLELVKAKLGDPLLTTLDERVERKMHQVLNSSFGTLQGTLASILGPSPSVSSTGCASDDTAPPAS